MLGLGLGLGLRLLEKTSASSSKSACCKYMCHADYMYSADYFREVQQPTIKVMYGDMVVRLFSNDQTTESCFLIIGSAKMEVNNDELNINIFFYICLKTHRKIIRG